MTGRLLATGAKVKIDKRSEHYPGATVYIKDVEPNEDYTYCVSASSATNAVADAHWVKREHVKLYKRPYLRPSRVKLPKPIIQTPPPIQVGDYVEVNSIVIFGPRRGYVLDVEPGESGCIAISTLKDGHFKDINVWVRKQYVQRVDEP